MITTRIINADNVSALFGTLPPTLQRETILGLSQATFDGAQTGAQRHSKTGALVQSLYNRAAPKGRAVGHDPQRAPYAIFVNLGTRPHVIRPKNKRALRWPVGGRFVFATKVDHPGYIGDAYLYKSADTAVAKMGAIVDAAIRKANV